MNNPYLIKPKPKRTIVKCKIEPINEVGIYGNEYKMECGYYFVMNKGDGIDYFKYCPFCGKKLKKEKNL